MNSLYKFSVSVILLFCISATAQQDPNFVFYRFNMNLINPSFAGANETTNLGVNVRSQWSNVQGAPETQSLLFSTPVGSNVGLGVSAISDRTFIERQTSLALDFSYKLQMNEKVNLYLGIKAGLNSYDVNTKGLLTYGFQEDPNLMNLAGTFNPNFGIGLLLKHEKYFLSLSAPKILKSDRLEQDEGIVRSSTLRQHFYLAGGYDFELSNNLMFKPSILFRYVDATPVSIDLTALFEFNKSFNVGVGYRIDESISGITLFNISRTIQIGYAYEVGLTEAIRSISNGSHELLLNCKF